MNKEQYLSKLNQYLCKLPQEEKHDIISEIELHFTESYKKNRTDEEIIQGLGAPKKLASSFLLEYDINRLGPNDTWLKHLNMIFKMIGLGFKNLILLPVFFAIGTFIFSLFLFVFCLYLLGGLLVITPVVKLIAPMLVNTAGIPIILLPIGGVFILYFTRNCHKMMNLITKKLYTFLLKYIKVDLQTIQNLV